MMSYLKDGNVSKRGAKTIVNDYFREHQLSAEDLPVVLKGFIFRCVNINLCGIDISGKLRSSFG